MDLLRNKKVIIAAVIVVVVIAGSWLLTRNNQKADEPEVNLNSGQKYDPDSGETISDPKGKDVDLYGTNPDAPLVLGTSDLIAEGVTNEQTDGLKYGLYKYFGGKSKKIDRISVVVDTIEVAPYDPYAEDSNVGKINFNVRVNQDKLYKVLFKYFDLDSVQVLIYDDTGATLLHDSGPLVDKDLSSDMQKKES